MCSHSQHKHTADEDEEGCVRFSSFQRGNSGEQGAVREQKQLTDQDFDSGYKYIIIHFIITSFSKYFY